MKIIACITLAVAIISTAYCQPSPPISAIDIGYNDNFSGFDLLKLRQGHVYIIAEDVHNRQYAPALTLKFMKALSAQGIRTLAIEGGASTAFLVNRFLQSQDTTLLRDIARHTFFWSLEHFIFFQALAAWNQTLPGNERIMVESADIEIKQESVLLAVNMLMANRSIPETLSTLATFRSIFNARENHRKQFNALNVQYYYDKKQCQALVDETLLELQSAPDKYRNFFGDHFDFFAIMMKDLRDQYFFNYRRSSKFKFRDDIIFDKLVAVSKRHPEGFLYVVGGKHTMPGASSFRLKHEPQSPFKNNVSLINLTGKMKNGKYLGAKVVTKLSMMYPDIFASPNIVICNDGSHPLLDAKYYDYTLALADNEHVRPFPNSFWGKR